MRRDSIGEGRVVDQKEGAEVTWLQREMLVRED